MRDRAMVFHDAQRIARKSFGEKIDIRENRPERCSKNSDSLLAFRKKRLAEKRARDSVSYRVHEGFKTAEVYTIRRVGVNTPFI